MALLPKKFLCCWTLRQGALAVGVVMLMTMCAVMVSTLVQATSMSRTEWSSDYHSRTAYGYSITANVYAFIMLLLQGVFFWAVWKNRTSTLVLSWAVLTAVWLGLSFVLFLVLIILYAHTINIVGWIICLLFGLFGFCILVYGLAVVVAYWLELHEATGGAAQG